MLPLVLLVSEHFMMIVHRIGSWSSSHFHVGSCLKTETGIIHGLNLTWMDKVVGWEFFWLSGLILVLNHLLIHHNHIALLVILHTFGLLLCGNVASVWSQ